MRVELNIQSQYGVDEDSLRVNQTLEDFEVGGLAPTHTHAVIEVVEAQWTTVLARLIQSLEKHYGYDFSAEKLHKVVTDYAGE